jgi:beta-glucosidase
VKKAQNTKSKVLPYHKPALLAAKRVQDLLSRMTLEERAAQGVYVWREKAEKVVDADRDFGFRKATVAFKKGYAPGQIGRPSDSGPDENARGNAELTNAIQKFFMEKARLGIPVIFHAECLHGHAAIDVTSFPQLVAPAPRASIRAATTASDQRSRK